MSNVFIKPAVSDGKPVLVRDPITKAPLKSAGEWKTRNQFWVRRLRDKDVVEALPPTAPTAAPAAQS